MDAGFAKYIDSLKKNGEIGSGAGEDIKARGFYRFTLEDVNTGKKEVSYYHNVVPTVGLTVIANNLTNPSPTHPPQITHAALGSSTSTVTTSDTQLFTETYRNAIASRTNSNNVAYATAFFNQTETTGTYREAGIFIDGTLTANSGVILSHVSINVTKTNVQKLTIDWTLTLS